MVRAAVEVEIADEQQIERRFLRPRGSDRGGRLDEGRRPAEAAGPDRVDIETGVPVVAALVIFAADAVILRRDVRRLERGDRILTRPPEGEGDVRQERFLARQS